MIDVFSPCKLQSAQIIYQSVQKEGAKSFLIRANNEIKILEELKSGKISFQEANRKRKAIVAWQHAFIQQDEIRLKQIESQNRINILNDFSEKLKDISEKAKEEIFQRKTTTTECWPDGRGGIRCDSTSF
jgi:Ran GTPase-activating protein (RanGAP) involved in mRNA processing and transport